MAEFAEQLYVRQTKDERQEQAYNSFKKAGGRGCIEWATGVGKTIALLKTARNLIDGWAKANKGVPKIIVGVPTRNLKTQWIEEIVKMNLHNYNIEVVVYKTLVKRTWECDLFLPDELHRLGAKLFIEAFTKVKYRFIFGATATLEREDGMHFLLKTYCPIVDTVTINEAMWQGWITPFKIYNLAVPFTIDEQLHYDVVNEVYNKNFGIFNNDFDAAMSCLDPDVAKVYNETNLHWESHFQVFGVAKKFAASMSERNKLITDCESKIVAGLHVVETFKDEQIISFGSTKEFADRFAFAIGKEAVAYHSDFSDKENAVTLETFRRERKRVISTAKSLDEGTNIPSVSLALVTSGTSIKRQLIQRLGRILRVIDGKNFAIIIILYMEGSHEINKLKKAQQGLIGVKWVNSIAEIYDEYNTLILQNKEDDEFT
jgi:superfamily II DNA or RNA helicase